MCHRVVCLFYIPHAADIHATESVVNTSLFHSERQAKLNVSLLYISSPYYLSDIFIVCCVCVWTCIEQVLCFIDINEVVMAAS